MLNSIPFDDCVCVQVCKGLFSRNKSILPPHHLQYKFIPDLSKNCKGKDDAQLGFHTTEFAPNYPLALVTRRSANKIYGHAAVLQVM